MVSQNELLEQIKNLVFAPKTIVSCPAVPMEIPGITAATELDAGDTLGYVITLAVPKSGVIYSATFFDLDDDGVQIDMEIFKSSIADVAFDALFAPTDDEILNFVTEIQFFAFDDHGSCRTSEVKNIGKAYNAPDGKFYIQHVTRGLSNIALNNMPRFQLQIQSFDPDFEV